MTFQSARQWETGLALLGIRKGLAAAGQAMTPAEDRSSIVARLDGLSHRRNKIVHEGDLRRLVRPRKITREQLLRGDVDRDLDWIRRFLVAMDSTS